MRRYICSHTYSYTYRTVYKKIRKFYRKNSRLVQLIIIVLSPVDSVFLYILQKLGSYLCHSRFCITVSSRRVAVNRTEVSVTVDKRVSHREILCKSYQCVIYRCVTVRVIFTENFTYRIGTFSVRLA